MRRWPFSVLAYICVGLALVGVVVPGLPTVPFLLVAAWSGARGSARLHAWLEGHPQLGPPLRAWREQGAVPARAKLLAVITLLLSWGLLVWHMEAAWVPVGAGLFFTAIAVFLLTRPTPREPDRVGRNP
ncbi:MAG: YbaN family protein [Gammaproteobacteria bacterium]|nr:YbaN family protein [Gammaproteobacteria bacterium]